MEFHDQKTAGIPGITPAYIGLKGRTTEKLCQTKDVVILKHQQCTLVGWELHPADRRRDIQGPERFLTHLPRCLFLKVEGATWQIDAKLGPGVFPLFPVIRSWELNAETSAQIKRRGFTWVPDFASTAFMIQGATLKAGLADCGDVTDDVGSSEAMTEYVILSRLQSAAGLLLLRAFSPALFRQGEPPGPHVLLKFLRGQKRGKQHIEIDTPTESAAESITYTFENALQEYTDRTKDLAQQRDLRKQVGPSWPCWCCKLFFPAAGFNAKVTRSVGVYDNCVAPGHWRCCTACTSALGH